MTIKPYDSETAEKIYSVLFCQGIDRDDGLTEIPSASIQLIISGLELMLWDLTGKERETIKKAIGIMEILRDEQKTREFKREYNPI